MPGIARKSTLQMVGADMDRLAVSISVHIKAQADLWKKIIDLMPEASLLPSKHHLLRVQLVRQHRLWMLGEDSCPVLLCLDTTQLLDGSAVRELIRQDRLLPASEAIPRRHAPAADIVTLSGNLAQLDAVQVVAALEAQVKAVRQAGNLAHLRQLCRGSAHV